MKKLILTTTFLAAGLLGVLAQGTVDFSNLPTKFSDSATVDRYIYGLDGLIGNAADRAAAGTKVGLVYDNGTGLQTAATAALVGPGVFIGGTKTLAGTSTGQTVQLQVQAWDAAFATYADAVAGNGAFGSSPLFSYVIPAAGQDPSNYVMGGMRAFSLAVPEPSTIAMGVVGLGALLLFRRRKN